jgi:hypothetical protein
MGSLSIMDARFRCGTRRLQLLSHGQVGIRRPQREDSWYRVHRSRLSNCHAYVKIERAGLCGCGRSTAAPNFGRRNPAKLAPFCSVLLLEKASVSKRRTYFVHICRQTLSDDLYMR